MADISDILEATTIAAFLEALNAHYQLGLLTHPPSDSPYSELWGLRLERVQENPGEGVLFTASTGEVSVFPFLPGVEATLTVKVLSSGSKAGGLGEGKD